MGQVMEHMRSAPRTLGTYLNSAFRLAHIVAIGLVVIPAAPVLGGKQEESARPRSGIDNRQLTLPRVIDIVISRNLKLVESRLSIREKEHQRREAFSDFFPTLDVNYSGEVSRYRQIGRVYQLAQSHNSRWTVRGNPGGIFGGGLQPDYPYRIDPYKYYSSTVTVTQPIFSAGRLLSSYKYAALGVDYAALQMEIDRQDLIMQTYLAYYSLMRAQKMLEVSQKSIAALETFRRRAKAFYDAKVTSKLDLLSAEVQLAAMIKAKTQAQTDIADYRNQLSYLMRLPPESALDIVHDYAYRPNSYRIQEIYSLAASNRTEIRQAGISVQQTIQLVKVMEGGLLPTVSLQFQASRFNDDWNVLDPEGTNDFKVTGAFQWSFDVFRQLESVKEMKSVHAKALTARDQLVYDILKEVGSAFHKMKRTQADISVNRAAADQSQEALRIARDRYTVMLATYLEFLDAERRWAQALGDYYSSLIDYRIDLAYLERTMGILGR